MFIARIGKASIAYVCFTYVCFLHSVTTFYASTLGCAAVLPVTDPTGTVLILDQDITISSACPLMLNGNAGNLTITSSDSHRLIIDSSVQWNISAITLPQAVIWSGNAQLIMLPGSQLYADQNTGIRMLFQDDSSWVVQP